jgi:hypothetical protein
VVIEGVATLIAEENMGTRNGRYNADFPKGSKVRIKSRQFLENFRRTWKYHHPLEESQVAYGGRVAEVDSVGYYHGGDELYRLKHVPGIWHEECLALPTEPVDEDTQILSTKD